MQSWVRARSLGKVLLACLGIAWSIEAAAAEADMPISVAPPNICLGAAGLTLTHLETGFPADARGAASISAHCIPDATATYAFPAPTSTTVRHDSPDDPLLVALNSGNTDNTPTRYPAQLTRRHLEDEEDDFDDYEEDEEDDYLGSIWVGYELYDIFETSDEDLRDDENYVSAFGDFEFSFFDSVYLTTYYSLYQVGDDPSSILDEFGLSIDELSLKIETDWIDLIGGKFDPTFGLLGSDAPGLFGTDLLNDYYYYGQIGAEAAIYIGDGLATLYMASFFQDTTELSDTFFQDVGRTRLEDGGVGNTEKFNNYSAVLRHEGDSFDISLAGRVLQAGEDDDFDESTAAFSFIKYFEYGDNIWLDLSGEAAYVGHAEGEEEDATYVTIGFATGIDRFSLGASHTSRKYEDFPMDRISTFSTSIDFTDTLSLTTGYSLLREFEDTTHNFGLILSYYNEF